jgi:hypothetical protein
MRLFVALAAICLPVVVVADPPTGIPRFWADGSSTQANIERRLQEPLESLGLEFVDTPLDEVAAFVSDQYKFNVVLDQSALNDLGVHIEEPVTVTLRNISLAAALKLMLRPLDLTYLIDGESLVITSIDEACTRTRTAVYPVADLAKHYPMQEIIDAIISLLPEAFRVNGGTDMITPLGDRLLVVNTSHAVHEQIAGLLAALRAAEKSLGADDLESKPADNPPTHQPDDHDGDDPFGRSNSENPFG